MEEPRMRQLLALCFALVLAFASPFTASAAVNQAELDNYLTDIEWSQEELEWYLEEMGLVISDFDSVDELRDFLGPVLTEENLQDLLDEYGLTRAELEELLAEYGETLDDYKFYDDLDFAIGFYLNGEDWDDLYSDFFEMIGLTPEELDRLIEHFKTLDYEDPAFEARLLNLSDRLMAFEEFDEASELTERQIAELLDIFSEMLDLFELDVKMYLVKGDEKIALSLRELVSMTTTNGYDLLIELYNLEGEFLADILLRAEDFGWDLIQETGKDLKKVNETVQKQDGEVTKTVKGAKLPKTASNYLEHTLYGLLLALGGVFVYRRFSVKQNG
ncbi:processed acidic surface protein [Halalkalibacterium halodurans]|nr:processed acidic surface protein [Halalkalibacterium halodurans]